MSYTEMFVRALADWERRQKVLPREVQMSKPMFRRLAEEAGVQAFLFWDGVFLGVPVALVAPPVLPDAMLFRFVR